TSFSTAASSETSATQVAARAPPFWSSPAVASRVSRRVPASITAAPSATKRVAIARPMPRPPPVMSATFPESLTRGSLASFSPAPHQPHRAEDQPRAEPPARLEALGADRDREQQREHRLEREQQAHAPRRQRALGEDLKQ